MLRFLRYMIQLVMSPTHGWEDISGAGEEPDRLMSRGLYPFMGLAAASSFVKLVYEPGLGIVVPLESAIVIFASYFMSLYLAFHTFPTMLRKCTTTEVHPKRVNTFIIYSLGILTLITLIENLVPVDVSLINFLPLLVALVMWRGERYLDVESDKAPRFVITAIGLILLPPIVLIWLLSIFIPSPQ